MEHRNYLRAEIEVIVAPTVADLLREEGLYAKHAQDVVGSHPWLKETLAAAGGAVDKNAAVAVADASEETLEKYGEKITGRKMLTMSISFAGFRGTSVDAVFHFKEVAGAPGFYELCGQTPG